MSTFTADISSQDLIILLIGLIIFVQVIPFGRRK